MLGAIELDILRYICSYKACSFFVYSSLGLDLVDSMDTLLAYGFGASILFFSSHKVVVSSCYKLLLWGTNKSR